MWSTMRLNDWSIKNSDSRWSREVGLVDMGSRSRNYLGRHKIFLTPLRVNCSMTARRVILKHHSLLG